MNLTGRRVLTGGRVQWELLSPSAGHRLAARHFSTSNSRRMKDKATRELQSQSPTATVDSPKLTHVSESGSARMVSISAKAVTSRVATAACTVVFTSTTACRLIRENGMKKGDVLGTARIAGIMAAKRTAELIPLCHPIAISRVSVELAVAPGDAEVQVRATVGCDGKTGVEMEALTAAGTAALTVYDMCKAVDKGMRIEALRVVLKEGGKSGRWVEGLREGEGKGGSGEVS